MVQVALEDNIVQLLLKTGEVATQVCYLTLAVPGSNWTTPEVVSCLPVFFGHLPPAEMVSTPLADTLFDEYTVYADGKPSCDRC